MTLAQRIITVAVVVFGTMLTRFLPFFVFPSDKPTPKYIRYLGKVLPSAVFGLLVVYCFKNVNPLCAPFAVPEIISCIAVVILHVLKRQMFLSIAGGTVIYMLLVQFVF